MQAIYDLVGDKVRDVFDAQVVTISTFDTDNQRSVLQYGIEKGERFYDDPSPLTEGHRRFIQARQPLLISEDWEKRMREFGYLVNIVPGTQMPKSTVFVPLIANNEVKGSVSLQNVDRENAFSETDVRLLTTLANSMSVALENARLFDEVQKRNQEITEALEQQTATSEILRVTASSPTDIQPVLDVIAQNAAQLSGSDDVLIDIEDKGILRVAAHYGNIPMIPVGEGIPFNRNSVAGRAIIEGRVLQALHKQPGEESEYTEGDKWAQKYGYRMTCAVPLMREGKAIGSISIRRLEPKLLDQKRIELLKSFADQAVIALENVRLFTETQRLLKETEQRAQELAIINSVQEGLASKLDMQAIYDLVGDKIQSMFNAQSVIICFV